jgi:hypothetical protein
MNACDSSDANQNTFNSALKLGLLFKLSAEKTGKVSEIFSQGFNYHTLDIDRNCIQGQQYMLKTAFNHQILTN